MKKLALTLLLLFGTIIMVEATEMELVQLKPTRPSQTETPFFPEAKYDPITGELIVLIKDNNAAIVKIVNSDSQIECEEPLSITSEEQKVSIPNLEPGNYTVTVSNAKDSFNGTLKID